MPALTQKELQDKFAEVDDMKKRIQTSEQDLKDKTRSVSGLQKQSNTFSSSIHDMSNDLNRIKLTHDRLRVTLKKNEERSDLHRDNITSLHNDIVMLEVSGLQISDEVQVSDVVEDSVTEDAAKPTFPPGLVQLNFEDAEMQFVIPEGYTFKELMKDGLRYFQTEADLVALEDEEARVWASKSDVIKEMNLTPEVLQGRMAAVHMRLKDLEKSAEQTELEAYKPSRDQQAAEICDEIDAAQLALIAEERRKRDATRKELMSYIIFVVAFMFVISGWRDTYTNFHMRNSIQIAVLEEDFSKEQAHFQKNYFDIANGDEFFQYMRYVFVEQVGLGDEGLIAVYNYALGGIRLRQLRVGDGSCTVPSQYDKFPELGCFAPYSASTNSNKPFGPGGRWRASEGNPNSKSVTGKLASYGPGGFILDFPLDHHNFTMGLGELEDNSWIDQGTRAVFVEMLVYNLNVNLFECMQIIVEFSAGGLAYPWVRFLPLQIQESTGFWTGSIDGIMQLLYVGFILLFTKKFITELRSARTLTDPPNVFNAFSSGWNVMEFLIIILAYTFALLMMLYQSDPQAQSFDMRVDHYTDMFPVAEYAELITQINALSCILVWWKILKYFNLSVRFSIMSNTLTNAVPNILTFLLMFLVVFIAFGAMAMLLYGTTLHQFNSFGYTLISLFLFTLGDFDYHSMNDITKHFTPVFMFSFIIVVLFVMLNMFIGIIAEAYATENAKPKVSLANELADFLESMRDGVVGPITNLVSWAKETAQKIKDEEEKYRLKKEAAKKRAATGQGIVQKLKEKDCERLATRVETLWGAPLQKFKDYSLDEKLSEYKLAENQLKIVIDEVTEAGYADAQQMFEVELVELENLATELEGKIQETNAAIKEEDKEKEASEDTDAAVVEEANPLLKVDDKQSA